MLMAGMRAPPRKMQALPRPAKVGKTCEVEFNPCVQKLQERNPSLPDKYLPYTQIIGCGCLINIVYTSTEWTGGHQDHLLYLYLLMTTPNSQIHIRKPFVWVSVNLCAFPPPRGFSPLPCPAGLIALCISVCLFFNKLVFGSWKHSLLLDDSL